MAKKTRVPKVSIIVTCYKGGEFLPRCLKSLTEQTLKEIEIICVNDGSPDNTREVLGMEPEGRAGASNP